MRLEVANHSFCIDAPEKIILRVKKTSKVSSILNFLSSNFGVPVNAIELYNQSILLSPDCKAKELFSPGSSISLQVPFPSSIFKEAISVIKQDNNDKFLVLMVTSSQSGWDLSNLKSAKGKSLIHYACTYGSNLIAQNLYISNENSLNWTTNEGWTPLMLACFYGHFQLVKFICALNQLVINQVTSQGTALHKAVEGKRGEILKVLLENGGDLQTEDNNGKTCIEIEASEEILEMIPIFTGECMALKSFDLKSHTQVLMATRVTSKYSKDYKCHISVSIADGKFKQFSPSNSETQVPQYKKKLIKLQYVQSCSVSDSQRKFYFKIVFPQNSLKYWVDQPAQRDFIIEKIKKASDYCKWKQIGIRPYKQPQAFQLKKVQQIEDNCSFQKEISLKEFEKLDTIGSGSFGVVSRIRHRLTGEIFALKSCERINSNQESRVKFAIIECEILRSVHNPFIVRLYWAIATKKHLNFILEYCPGGDLSKVLNAKGALSDNDAKFVLASIVVALDVLHSKDVVCRDLKPANVLIDSCGYLKICDFGLAQNHVKGEKMNAVLVGSPSYLSPEGILNDKVGKQSDIWALGIIAYQLHTGYMPFTGADIQILYNNIIEKEPAYPTSLSLSSKNFIKMLIEKDPTKRLNIEQVKAHEYFQSVDWKIFAKKKYQPPEFLLVS